MTQHGSFPGRPRGRRARPESGEPEWQGFDATPQDEREFPDLTPIRSPEARARDGRAPGDGNPAPGPAYPGQGGAYPAPGGAYPGPGGAYPAQDGAYPGQDGAYPGQGAGYPQGGPGRGGYGDGQPGGQYRGGEYPDSAYPDSAYPDSAYPDTGQGQAPWGDPDRGRPGQQQAPEQWPGQPPWAEQQAVQPLAPAPQSTGPEPTGTAPQAGPRTGAQPSRPDPLGGEDGEDVPSWAEPDSVEAFSSRWHRRGLDSRDERRSGRRKRRRILIAAGIVLALIIGTVTYLLSGGPGAADLGFGGFVTTFQQGELQQVPNPCTAVPAATISQYLPGKAKEAAPPENSGFLTECSWTLDHAPTYRVLQVQLEAYSPSGLASGNGSATFAALDEYESIENNYTNPGPKSGQPSAKVTDLSGMPGGTDTSAFQATQVFDRGGATMDVSNVLVRYRNVIITVVVDGLSQSSGTKYGPVTMSDLTVIADSVAKQMAAQIAK